MVTMQDLIARAQQSLDAAISARGEKQAALLDLRDKIESGDESVTREMVAALAGERDALDSQVREAQAKLDELRAEDARDAEIAELRTQIVPTEVRAPKYDEVARVGTEKRTYSPESDPNGKLFLQDVVRGTVDGFNDFEARERISRHMTEERVERGDQLVQRGDQLAQRAAGTTAFAGLVVPQYLTDMVAPYAKAARPFADACRKHDLPASGMTVNISRITTATTAAVQTQGNAVSETDIDDTLLTVNVQTVGGSQTITRQAAERGTGVEDVTIADLITSHATAVDSTLLNQGTNGLTNVATAIAYTDGTPTAAELYPKLLAGVAAVEAALVNQDPGANLVVMHSRRWYWLQSQLSSTFPLIGQPQVPFNVAGMNFGERYGAGYRGVLPNGTPVIVDNNIATNLGAGTNEDEIYFVSANECHLWEDANAPLLIRTETGPSVKSLGVDIVVYSYLAYTFARYTHSQKVNGTGLVTPTF